MCVVCMCVVCMCVVCMCVVCMWNECANWINISRLILVHKNYTQTAIIHGLLPNFIIFLKANLPY